MAAKKKVTKKKIAKKSVAKSGGKSNFILWEEPGQKIQGKITGFASGQFGAIINIGKKQVNATPFILVQHIKRAIDDKVFKIGATVKIEYLKRQKRTKLFRLTIGKKVYEPIANKKISANDFTNLISEKFDSLSETYRK